MNSTPEQNLQVRPDSSSYVIAENQHWVGSSKDPIVQNKPFYSKLFHGPNGKDSPNLDLLRAVAVLCVLVSHIARAAGYLEMGSLGRFGVVLFFVHTSFVLMASLDRSQGDISSFAIRRIFRIYPLAIFCILAVALFQVPVEPGVPYHWMGTKAFFANLLLSQNLLYKPSMLAPLWSLPLEVQMYCILPALYFLIRRSPRAAIAIWVVSCVCALSLPNLNDRLGVFSFAPCFASGVLAYALSAMNFKRHLPPWTWPLTIAAVILMFHPFDNRPLAGSALPLAWALSLLLGLAIAFTGELKAPSLHRATHLIAQYSYGIYLSHIIVLWFAFDVMRGSPVSARILTGLIGVIGIPFLLFHGIEAPMIRLGQTLSRPAPPKQQQRELALQ